MTKPFASLPGARSILAVCFVAVLVAACAGTGSGGVQPPLATCSTPTPADDETASEETLSLCDDGMPGGAVGSGATASPSAPSEGYWVGTVTNTWTETVREPGNVATQTYSASVAVDSTYADLGRWDLAGTASITSSFTSDVVNDMDTPLGHCHEHFTDNAAGSGTAPMWGGLEFRNGHYQLLVNVGNLVGQSVSIRDETGCFGGSTTEEHEWPIATWNVSYNGDSADPDRIADSDIRTTANGQYKVTWDLHRVSGAGGAAGGGAVGTPAPTETPPPGTSWAPPISGRYFSSGTATVNVGPAQRLVATLVLDLSSSYVYPTGEAWLWFGIDDGQSTQLRLELNQPGDSLRVIDGIFEARGTGEECAAAIQVTVWELKGHILCQTGSFYRDGQREDDADIAVDFSTIAAPGS